MTIYLDFNWCTNWEYIYFYIKWIFIFINWNSENLTIYHLTCIIVRFHFCLDPFQLCSHTSINCQFSITQTCSKAFVAPWYYSDHGFASIVVERQRTFLDISNKLSENHILLNSTANTFKSITCSIFSNVITIFVYYLHCLLYREMLFGCEDYQRTTYLE